MSSRITRRQKASNYTSHGHE